MRLRFALLAWLLGVALPASAQDDAQVQRGLYIARLGDCAACHTAPGRAPYAGGYPMRSPFGTIYSSNITPDSDDGIGRYSFEDFDRALRKGIARDGRRLYPAMPYASFSGMSDADMQDLYAYFMQDVAPAQAAPQTTKLPFPFNQRWALFFWQAVFLPQRSFHTIPTQDAAWNRGAYIVQTLGHCGACHTPRGPAYEEEAYDGASDLYLSGQALDNWFAPDLRGNPALGLGGWSEADISTFLRTGHAAGVTVFGSMEQAVEDSLRYLTPDDADAVAHYLKSLSANDPFTAGVNSIADRRDELPGRGLYAGACAMCHGRNAEGKGLIPKLAGNPAIVAPDASSVMRLLLEGGRTPQLDNGSVPQKMPSFARWSDQEIADVTSYIRRNWGNRSAAVTARDVARMRAELARQKAPP